MHINKRCQWIVTFSVLSLFTVHILSGLTGRTTASVFAQTIEDESAFANSQTFVVIHSEPARQGIARAVELLVRRHDREKKVCALDHRQSVAVAALFTLDPRTVSVAGRSVQILDFSASNLSVEQLQAQLTSLHLGSIQCRTVESDRQIIFPLPIDVS